MAYSTNQVVRVVHVTNIPYITDESEDVKDKLEIHFGKKKHGGGEIETIICPVGGNISQAFVVFESVEAARIAANYYQHVFEEAEIKVSLLPEVYSYVEVELEDYYWEILTPKKATTLIGTLKNQLGQDHVFHKEKKILKLHGSYKQLEDSKELILISAGIGLSNQAAAAEKPKDVIARSLELSEIPFVTEDADELVVSLRDFLQGSGEAKVVDILCPVKGSMQRAIVVFQSEDDREKFLQQDSHTFEGEDLQCKLLPTVYKKATITLNTFYTSIVSKSKISKIRSQLKEKYRSEFTDKEIAGPFENLMDIISTWMDMAGFSFKFISENEYEELTLKHGNATASREKTTDVPEMDENIDNLPSGSPELSSWVNVSQEVINEPQKSALEDDLKMTSNPIEEHVAMDNTSKISSDKDEDQMHSLLAGSKFPDEKEDINKGKKNGPDSWVIVENEDEKREDILSGSQSHHTEVLDTTSSIDQGNGSNILDGELQQRNDGDKNTVGRDQHDEPSKKMDDVEDPRIAAHNETVENELESTSDTDKEQQDTTFTAGNTEPSDKVETLDSSHFDNTSIHDETEDSNKKRQPRQKPDDKDCPTASVNDSQSKSEYDESLSQFTIRVGDSGTRKSNDSHDADNDLKPKDVFKGNPLMKNASSCNGEIKRKHPKIAASFSGVQTSSGQERVNQPIQTKDSTTSSLRDEPEKVESAAASGKKTSGCNNKHAQPPTREEMTKQAASDTTDKSREHEQGHEVNAVATTEKRTSGHSDKHVQSATGEEMTNKPTQAENATDDRPSADKPGQEESAAASDKIPPSRDEEHDKSLTREEIVKTRNQAKNDTTGEPRENKHGNLENKAIESASVMGTLSSGDKHAPQSTKTKANKQMQSKYAEKENSAAENGTSGYGDTHAQSSTREKQTTKSAQSTNGSTEDHMAENEAIAENGAPDSSNKPAKSARSLEKTEKQMTNVYASADDDETEKDASVTEKGSSDYRGKHAQSSARGEHSTKSAQSTNGTIKDHMAENEAIAATLEKGKMDSRDKPAKSPRSPKKTGKQMTNEYASADDDETEKDASATASVKGTPGYSNNAQSPLNGKEDVIHMQKKDDTTEKPSDDKAGKEANAHTYQKGTTGLSDNHAQSPSNQETTDQQKTINKDAAEDKLEDEELGEKSSGTASKAKKAEDIDAQAQSSTSRETTNEQLQNKYATSDKLIDYEQGKGASASIREKRVSGSSDENFTHTENVAATKSQGDLSSQLKPNEDSNTKTGDNCEVKLLTTKNKDLTSKSVMKDRSSTANVIEKARSETDLESNNKSPSKGKISSKQDQSRQSDAGEKDKLTEPANHESLTTSIKKNKEPEDGRSQHRVASEHVSKDGLKSKDGGSMKKNYDIQDTGKSKMFETPRNGPHTRFDNHSSKIDKTGEEHGLSNEQLETNSNANKRKLEQSGNAHPTVDPNVKKVKEKHGSHEDAANKSPPPHSNDSDKRLHEDARPHSIQGMSQNSQTHQNTSEGDDISTTASSAASSEPDAAADFVTIDSTAFEVLSKTAGDELKSIETRFKVRIKIQPPNDKKTTSQSAIFQPLPDATKQDQNDAKEEFINLYQDMFFKIKRLPLKCDELPQKDIARALQQTELKMAKIVINRGERNEYVFCGEESVVNAAIAFFRQEAGIKPKTRRLLKKSDSGSDRSAPNDTSNRPLESVPSSYPSVFYTKENLAIHVLKADITKQKVDIIVNASDYKLNNGGGVALAIVNAAGRKLQNECEDIMRKRNHYSIPIGECVVTNAYKLNCKLVIHAVGPQYQGDHNAFHRKLVTTFTNVLRFAETKAARSIAIPLISSGTYGGPKEACASALASALFNFSFLKEASHVQQVYLVNIDDQATATLQSTFAGIFPTADVNEQTSTNSNKVSPQADIKTSTFTTPEGIEVVVVKGDITKGSVEVIVNAANGRLSHGGGVAGAISRAAGKGLQDESYKIISQRQKPLDVGECVVTDAYNINCSKVIHAVGPIYDRCKTDKQFLDLLRLTFLTAIKYANLPIEMKRVAFPLISSGIYGGPKHLCAKAFVEAVQEFSKNEKNLILEKIYMVNIDDEATQAVRRACQACFVHPQPTGIASSQTGDAQTTHPLQNTHPRSQPDKSPGYCATSARGISLHVINANIVKQDVDIIVNPTTPTIGSQGGISKAVFREAGYKLGQHCKYIFERTLGSKTLSVGDTILTDGFELPCKKIIHTLGPQFDAKSPQAFTLQLEYTFLNCMKMANKTTDVKSIAFPLVASSTGPKKTCAKALADAISAFDKSEEGIRLRNIIMVSNDKESISAVENTLRAYFDSTMSSGEAKELTRDIDMGTPKHDHRSKENIAISQTATHSTGVGFTQGSKSTLTPTANNQPVMSPITSQPMSQVRNASSGVDIPLVTSYNQAQYSDVVKGKKTTFSNQKHTPVSSAAHSQKLCGVCKMTKENIQTLDGCKHKACFSCIKKTITPNSTCQECGAVFGFLEEQQFGGKMKYHQMNVESPSESSSKEGFIVMKFNISNGFQNRNHPHPGKAFKGLFTMAYLPHTHEGREVLLLFRWAFLNGQLFEIKPASSASGDDRLVPAKDIEFKYKYDGGFEKGFPDSKYLPEMKRILDKKQIEFANGSGSSGGSPV